jgi:GH35 family endo-1,4-beta-xylanase
MKTVGEGGEEWRRMEGGAGAIDSAASRAAVSAAKANIEKIRKRDVELRVVDRQGGAVAGETFEVVQKRHAFCFGDQMWALDRMYRFGEADTDRGKYWKRRFADVLNAANALCYWTERPRSDGPKTEDLQGLPALDGFHYCVDWARSEGLTVKGHPLFWSIAKCVPQWVKRYDYETQMKFAEVRVRGLVASVRGKVALWDLVNEPMWEPAFRNLPQRHWPHLERIEAIADYIEPVLGWARDEDPDARYLINDYGMQEGSRKEPPVAADGTKVTAALQRRRFLELLRCLGDRGAVPDAIGLQSHTGGWTDHASQTAVYDEMAASGLPIHITEFWAHTRGLEADGRLPQDEIDRRQADYVADYLTCAFGHPAVEAFFFWGFMGQAIRWGQYSSHELKPMYDRVRELVRAEWTTRERLTSDGDGRVRFRGFYGDYALRYDAGGGTARGVAFRVDRQQSYPLAIIAPLARHAGG